MLTLIDILKRSEEYLREHGIDEPRRNAELLASRVLDKSRIDLYLEHDRPMEEAELKRLRDVLAQRKEHRPLQYIFGETEFFGLPISVGPSVLIPRPETELLVEETLKILERTESAGQIVYDLGTGSGCIAIAIAKNCDNCRIFASDVSADALKMASANAERNSIAGRIDFLHGPDFGPFRNERIRRADIVATNPPYVRSGDFAGLEPEVRDNEPRQALDGGKDGLDVIRRIISAAGEYINEGGWLVMEIGIGQSEEVAGLLEAAEAFDEAIITKDYQNIDRIITAKRKTQAV